MSKPKVRVNVTVDEELKVWYEDRAARFGISMAAMMRLALSYVKDTYIEDPSSVLSDMGKAADSDD